jgi:hypothetical protein
MFGKINIVIGLSEVDMDKYLGSESLMAQDTLIRMSLDRESEMRDTARTEYYLISICKGQPSLYARVMTRLGDRLVVYGTWLKTHYSVQQAYRAN